MGLGAALGKGQEYRVGELSGFCAGLAVGFVLGVAMVFSGCAAHQVVRYKVVVPNECIVSVAKGENTACHGDDINALHCTGIVLVKKSGCETVQVINKEKK